uniref:Uncharacterized protein n=1 Tax=Zea mays TaxID=4577 RepID=C0PA87_MAIZE|nr:unknown [Zea mays]
MPALPYTRSESGQPREQRNRRWARDAAAAAQQLRPKRGGKGKKLATYLEAGAAADAAPVQLGAGCGEQAAVEGRRQGAVPARPGCAVEQQPKDGSNSTETDENRLKRTRQRCVPLRASEEAW